MRRLDLVMPMLAGIVLAGTVLAGCAEPPEKVELYDRSPVPAVPASTRAIDPAWVGADDSLSPDDLTDGEYWAEAVGAGSGRPFILFDLSQALFGQICFDTLGEDECSNDYGVVASPHGTFEAALDSLVSVTVVGADRQNYAVTPTELASLVWGGPPHVAAPSDFAYTPYPFLLSVRDGVVVEAHQIWVP
jgi:hypothetical protein